MTGEVEEQQFARLSEGQHPATGEQLVRHQTAREYENERGQIVRSMEHRAGWDATFSAPKSVSLTALVGGDDRVREAHRESVRTALDEMEKYVQARMGGNAPAQTTGAWTVAQFEHDSSRPVDGYAAPQLSAPRRRAAQLQLTHAAAVGRTPRPSFDVRPGPLLAIDAVCLRGSDVPQSAQHQHRSRPQPPCAL